MKLTVTNIAGTNSTTKINYITVAAPVPPTAAFSSNVQSGTAPLTIQFTDKSSGTSPLSYAWDFTNDGDTDSTIKSPSFTYATPGTYSVKLTVTNIAGTNSTTKINYITVAAPVPPTAAFSSNVQTGTFPLLIRFTDESGGTGPLTYAWDFDNDGDTDSTGKSPSYTFTAAGTYSVKLTVTNIAGTDNTTRIDYIIVTPPKAPVAAFTSNVQSGISPLAVRFTDQSSNTPVSWIWELRKSGGTWTGFGSGVQNPSKTFTTGTYRHPAYCNKCGRE